MQRTRGKTGAGGGVWDMALIATEPTNQLTNQGPAVAAFGHCFFVAWRSILSCCSIRVLLVFIQASLGYTSGKEVLLVKSTGSDVPAGRLPV